MEKAHSEKKLMPTSVDGLIHVNQKGVDRAFDPVDFHEVTLDDNTEVQTSPEAWIEEQIAEDEKREQLKAKEAEEKKKRAQRVQKVMPDGLVHVTQNGKDRAFDP